VTGVPDDSRGERLVALYTRADMTSAQVSRGLAATGLPKLWLPKREDIVYVYEIPLLGSGKIDLRAAKQLAMELTYRDELAVAG
jgi:acyl-[acyl-carrier-protein]-phospholipid O-acyltransferase/long-chain-fatty-acid--[acyl-carrier-protein] ligase